MGKYMIILMFLLIAIAVVFATYNLSIIDLCLLKSVINFFTLRMIKSL